MIACMHWTPGIISRISMKRIFSSLLTIAAACGSESPPNIVFILADDLGITDIGAYARHFADAKEDELFYETPHLDKLSADGISFSQSYTLNNATPNHMHLEKWNIMIFHFIRLMVWIVSVCIVSATSANAEESSVKASTLPLEANQGFLKQQVAPHVLSDENYFVWCVTAMRWTDGKIHAYYSRWPKKYAWRGWRTRSEIAHAVADSPEGPFRTTGTVLSCRNPGGWSGINAHTPSVCVIDGKIHIYFVANKIGDFYKGTPEQPLPGDEWLNDNMRSVHLSQRIVVAVADKPDGPFVTSDKPVFTPKPPFKDVVCNPAVVEHNGKCIMIIKGDDARHEKPFRMQCVAIADNPLGPFEQVDKPILEDVSTEDACIWYDKKRRQFRSVVHVLYEPRLVELVSDNGRDWRKAEPFLFMRKEFHMPDGTIWKPDRVERPFVLTDPNGSPEWLYVGTKQGNLSANIAVRIKENPK